MAYAAVGEPAEFCLVARRNQSLTSTGRRFVLAAFLIVSLAISLAFTVLGAWPVLPFAGLEILALWWAFRQMERQADDYERIAVEGDRLIFERRVRGVTERVAVNKCWAQVRYIPSRPGQRASVVIRAHGKEVSFGRHLPEDRIMDVALQLGRQVRAR